MITLFVALILGAAVCCYAEIEQFIRSERYNKISRRLND